MWRPTRVLNEGRRGPPNWLNENALVAVESPLDNVIRHFLTQVGGIGATGNTRPLTSPCLTLPRLKLPKVPTKVVRLRAKLR